MPRSPVTEYSFCIYVCLFKGYVLGVGRGLHLHPIYHETEQYVTDLLNFIPREATSVRVKMNT